MRALIAGLLVIGLAACDLGPEPPIGRLSDGPARFEFVASWEPSIEDRAYSKVVVYSLALRNTGGRASVPTCRLLLRGEPLPGWSDGTEIGVESEGRVPGESLLPYRSDPTKVLSRLEPRCAESTGQAPVTPVIKRFFGADGDQAYFELTRRGFKVRFGPGVERFERLNVAGQRTHPEVVITGLEHEPETKTVTITEVDCVGREASIC